MAQDIIEATSGQAGEAPARDAATLAITRGAMRLLADLGYATVPELDLPSGRRADLFGLAQDGGLVIVEVKSCVADYRADLKWPEYRDYADALYFAVDERFPRELLPEDVGVIVADAFGGAVVRPSPVRKLPPARRKALTLRAARAAAMRLARLALAGAS